MSQEIFSVTQNYGSTLAIDGCDEHRWLNLSITDCDGTRTEEITLSPVAGYYLRNSELTLLNGSLLARHRRVDFKNTDLCLVLGVKRNHLIVLTPRKEMGLIHVDKVEVAS